MMTNSWKRAQDKGLIPYLNKWKTIHFSTDQMRQLIGFGTPVFDGIVFKGFKDDCSDLQLGIWLSFVPKVYRAQCEQICLRFPSEKFEGMRCYDPTRDLIIRHLQQRILAEVKPV